MSTEESVIAALESGEMELSVRPGTAQGIGAIVHMVVYAKTARAAALTRPFAAALGLNRGDSKDYSTEPIDTVTVTVSDGAVTVSGLSGWSILLGAAGDGAEAVAAAARSTGRGVLMVTHGTEWAGHFGDQTMMAHAAGDGRSKFHEGWVTIEARSW
ncbi:hypothetical protein [Nocardia asiatica]|uniref:hypothetical protein n=1 Tax=Nocardia asiatica TaxID=209252 RepID=UPI000311D8E8|nr:hypothetical protein [Nocardia asiatica]